MTPERRWRIAFATSIGTSHQRSGSPCQDACGCTVVEAASGAEVLVAAVSDGSGTASRSDIGSAKAVAHFIEFFARAATVDPDLQTIDRCLVTEWFSELKSIIRTYAYMGGEAVGSYACTMLGVVIGMNTAAYIQIGDGAIVVAGDEPGDYAWVFWPQHGEYANSTFFVTQDGSEEKLLFENGPAPDEVAIFSDGIERLVLNMSSRAVHAPAFLPIFKWLSETEPDRSGTPSAALVAYLGSDQINSRTDDDKTLVVATRGRRHAKQVE